MAAAQRSVWPPPPREAAAAVEAATVEAAAAAAAAAAGQGSARVLETLGRPRSARHALLLEGAALLVAPSARLQPADEGHAPLQSSCNALDWTAWKLEQRSEAGSETIQTWAPNFQQEEAHLSCQCPRLFEQAGFLLGVRQRP